MFKFYEKYSFGKKKLCKLLYCNLKYKYFYIIVTHSMYDSSYFIALKTGVNGNDKRPNNLF